MAFSHIPVLLDEVLQGLCLRPDGIYLDATFGRGGHSREILKRLGPKGRLYALDRDPEAVAAAKNIDDPRFHIVRSPFSKLAQVCDDLEISGKVDGLLMDIGVSSPQLDDASRGFSFDRDGPLDMRMDNSCGITAADIVNTWDSRDLSLIFKEYGEERFASKAASAIVRERERHPFDTTLSLASFLEKVIPGPSLHKHKATRIFQALRIAVNRELDELKQALDGASAVLSDEGRLCVISFHSLEDRIVKNYIKTASQGNAIPKGLPITFEEAEKMRLATATMEPVGGAVKASEEEVMRNVRSRSATLRVAKRLKRINKNAKCDSQTI